MLNKFELKYINVGSVVV